MLKLDRLLSPEEEREHIIFSLDIYNSSPLEEVMSSFRNTNTVTRLRTGYYDFLTFVRNGFAVAARLSLDDLSIIRMKNISSTPIRASGTGIASFKRVNGSVFVKLEPAHKEEMEYDEEADILVPSE